MTLQSCSRCRESLSVLLGTHGYFKLVTLVYTIPVWSPLSHHSKNNIRPNSDFYPLPCSLKNFYQTTVSTRLHAELIQKCAFAFVYALSYAATLCASVFVSSSRGTAERRWWRVLGTVKPTSSTTIGPWWGSSSTRTSTPSVQVRDVTPPPPCFCSAVVFLWRSQTLVKFSANATTHHSDLSNSRSKSAALSNL